MDRRTELRRSVKHILSELILAELSFAQYIDLAPWAGIFGFTEDQLRAEIVRQAELMREQGARS